MTPCQVVVDWSCSYDVLCNTLHNNTPQLMNPAQPTLPSPPLIAPRSLHFNRCSVHSSMRFLFTILNYMFILETETNHQN